MGTGRIRTVKPELFQHEDLFDLEESTGLPLRLAYIGLFCQCDKRGRFKWRPKMLKARILPWDSSDFSRVLDALVTRGFVQKYTVGEDSFGCIPSFEKHQHINARERDSEFPPPGKGVQVQPLPPVHDASPTGEPHDVDGAPTEGNGRERKGMEGIGATPSEPPARALEISALLLGLWPEKTTIKDCNKQTSSWIQNPAYRNLDFEVEIRKCSDWWNDPKNRAKMSKRKTPYATLRNWFNTAAEKPPKAIPRGEDPYGHDAAARERAGVTDVLDGLSKDELGAWMGKGLEATRDYREQYPQVNTEMAVMAWVRNNYKPKGEEIACLNQTSG